MLSRTLHRVRNVSSILQRSPNLRRRLATEADHHGHGSSSSSAKGNGEEAIPSWIYISTGSVFSIWLLWTYIQPSATNPLTRYLSISDTWTKDAEEKSARHTKFIEQAARDKHLFLNTPGSATVEVRSPERIGVHSPYSHDSGWTRGRLMDELEAKLQRDNPKE